MTFDQIVFVNANLTQYLNISIHTWFNSNHLDKTSISRNF